MEFGQLQETEFEAFMQRHPLGNFLQSSAIGKRRSGSGWSVHMVGVKQDGVVIGAALLTSRPVFMGLADFECQQGPVMDYDNQELVNYFFTELKAYLRAHKALELLFNPPLLLNHRDGEAELILDGYSGEVHIKALEAAGARHLPQQQVDKDPLLLRWYFAKDMQPYKSKEQLLDDFDQQTRWSLRKTQKAGIEVVTLPGDQLDAFYDMIVHTAQRRHFDPRDKQYYLDLARHFGPERIMFTLARLDVPRYIANLKQQLAREEQEFTAAEAELALLPGDKKLTTRRRVSQEALDMYRAKLDQAATLQADQGDTIILAGAIFIHYGPELVYFASGSYDEYSSFNGPYALQWHALTCALEHQIPRYSFYGTKGDFSGHPDQQGVYKFKKGFGGVVEEQIGYFILTINPLMAWVRKSISKLRGLVG